MSESLVPESVLFYPPLYEDKNFIVLSDWLVLISRCEHPTDCFDSLDTGMARSRPLIPMIVRTILYVFHMIEAHNLRYD